MKKHTLYWLSFALMLSIVLLMNILTPMMIDDYRYALNFETGEILQSFSEIPASLIEHGNQVNGRYVPHFFVQSFTLLPPIIFDICNTIMYSLLILGIVRLCTGKWQTSTVLLWIIMATVFLIPKAFGQTMLWLSGSLNYLWCNTLMVWLWIPYFDELLKRNKKLGLTRIFLMLIGAVLLGNMSENTSASVGVFMGLSFIYVLCRERKVKLWMIITPLFVLAGWLLLMLSPANLLHVESTNDGLFTMIMRLSSTMEKWLNDAGLFSLCYFALLAFSIHKKTDKNLLYLSGGLMLCAFLSNIAMAFSHYYPERAFQGSVIMMTIACIMLLTKLLPCITFASSKVIAVFLACWVLITSCWAIPPLYERYMLATSRSKDVFARKEAGEMTLQTYCIEGLTRYDAYFGLIELTNETHNFLNQSYATYHGIDTIEATYVQ